MMRRNIPHAPGSDDHLRVRSGRQGNTARARTAARMNLQKGGDALGEAESPLPSTSAKEAAVASPLNQLERAGRVSGRVSRARAVPRRRPRKYEVTSAMPRPGFLLGQRRRMTEAKSSSSSSSSSGITLRAATAPTRLGTTSLPHSSSSKDSIETKMQNLVESLRRSTADHARDAAEKSALASRDSVFEAFRRMRLRGSDRKISSTSSPPSKAAGITSLDQAKQRYLAIDQEHQKLVSEWKDRLAKANAQSARSQRNTTRGRLETYDEIVGSTLSLQKQQRSRKCTDATPVLDSKHADETGSRWEASKAATKQGQYKRHIPYPIFGERDRRVPVFARCPWNSDAEERLKREQEKRRQQQQQQQRQQESRTPARPQNIRTRSANQREHEQNAASVPNTPTPVAGNSRRRRVQIRKRTGLSGQMVSTAQAATAAAAAAETAWEPAQRDAPRPGKLLVYPELLSDTMRDVQSTHLPKFPPEPSDFAPLQSTSGNGRRKKSETSVPYPNLPHQANGSPRNGTEFPTEPILWNTPSSSNAPVTVGASGIFVPYPCVTTADAMMPQKSAKTGDGFPLSPYFDVSSVPYPCTSLAPQSTGLTSDDFPASPFFPSSASQLTPPPAEALRTVPAIPYPLLNTGTTVADEVMQTPDWQGIFTRFYRQFAPAKATPENVAKLVKKYAKREIAVLKKLFKKYSVEPAQQLLFAGPDVIKPRGRVFPRTPGWDTYTTTPGGAAFWKGKDLVYLDVQFARGTMGGKVVVELFSDKVPRTCANFRALCSGELRGKDPALSYEGNVFHRIISGFMCQAGDTTAGNGTGGRSIYGNKFEDESAGLAMEHVVGTLSMANSGPNTNGSQFFLLLDAKPHLNGKHCVFGKVVAGMDIVFALGDVRVGADSRPVEEARIVGCGKM